MKRKRKLRYTIKTDIGYYAKTDYGNYYDMESRGNEGWHTYGPSYKHEKLVFTKDKDNAKELMYKGLLELIKRMDSILALGLIDIKNIEINIREVE